MPLHGALGGAPVTLAPSTRGIGPNTYLDHPHFFAMVGAAMIAHLAILGIYSMLPEEKVTAIPVQALSFKLGPQESIASFGMKMAVDQSQPALIAAQQPVVQPAPPPPAAPKPVAQQADEWRTVHEPVPAPRTVRIEQQLAKSAPVRQRPVENMQPPRKMPEQVIAQPPAFMPAPRPAIAPTPQRFVRETGLPSLTPITGGADRGYIGLGIESGTMGGQGTSTVVSAKAAEEARLRYTQQISAWVGRHIYYPAEASGQNGRVIVRIRLDRQGYLRYFAIERSSGNAYFDRTAIDVVRRSDPFPAPPPEYPAENLNEFTLPVDFNPTR